jgi:hypothetical protein
MAETKMDISKEKRELIKKTYNVEDADINSRIERELETCQKVFGDNWDKMNEKQKELTLSNRVITSYKTYDTGASVKSFVVVVHGIGRRMDMTAKRIKLAKDVEAKDRAKAIREGYVDKDGNALDRKEFFDAGQTMKNESFGKPLMVGDFQRRLYGLAIPLDDYEAGKDPVPFTMVLKRRTWTNEKGETVDIDPTLAENMPDKFKKYIVQAYWNLDEENEEFTLSYAVGNPDKPESPRTKFDNPEELTVEYDDNFLEKFMPEWFVEQSDLGKWHEENVGESGFLPFDTYCFVRGIVGFISPEVSAKGNRVIALEPETMDKAMTVILPDEHCKVDFTVGVPVTVIGTTFESEQDGEKKINMAALGIYTQTPFRVQDMEHMVDEGQVTVRREEVDESDDKEESGNKDKKNVEW